MQNKLCPYTVLAAFLYTNLTTLQKKQGFNALLRTFH